MILQRSDLTRRAADKAAEVRDNAGLDLADPICIYQLCDQLGLKVQFVDVSMEGMFVRADRPKILLSSLRPLQRRVYTCAHEIGHFLFGHGSTIDELQERADRKHDPDEFLAETFAGLLLMPKLGVRKAFVARGWRPDTPTPEQMLAVACNFGVGYETLANHMAFCLRILGREEAEAILKVNLPTVRQRLLGRPSESPLIVVDSNYSLPTVDAEVGSDLLLPPKAIVESKALQVIADVPLGRLVRASAPSIVRAYQKDTEWAVMVRISKFQYTGWSKYRHLEETDDE